MRKWILAAALSAAVTGVVCTPNAQAQGGGFGGGGGRGGQQNSAKSRLTRLFRNIDNLEKAKKSPLTKPQAKTIVTAISAWKTKPTMTEDQAKALYGKINGALTTKQKNELDKMAALNRRNGPREGGDRQGGGGQGGPGGGPGGGGAPNPQQMAEMRQRMQKMQGFFKTYNPFYPPAKYKEMKDMPERMRESFTKRYQSRMEVVTKLAVKAK